MQALPYLISGAGSVVQGMDAASSGNANAMALGQQATTAQAQGYADEQTQRRQSRQVLGTQAAAVAQAGGGSGGTTAKVMDQSGIAAELDSLNIRYGGLQKASGLMAQAQAERNYGRALSRKSYFLAGSDLLRGGAATYAKGA